jgi:hypothetical protein
MKFIAQNGHTTKCLDEILSFHLLYKNTSRFSHPSSWKSGISPGISDSSQTPELNSWQPRSSLAGDS